MDSRIKELIAVGASITANCQPCLQYHVTKALESEASQAEIGEAIEVGKMVRKGAAAKMDNFSLTLNQPVSSREIPSEAGCGCSS